MKYTLDSNVFISAYKSSEEYHEECKEIIKKLEKHTLIEPAILLSEVYNAIGRHISKQVAEKAISDLSAIVDIFVACDTNFCQKAGSAGVDYNIYSADSLYLQTALEFKTTFVTLDEKDLIKRVKAKDSKFDILHVRDLKL